MLSSWATMSVVLLSTLRHAGDYPKAIAKLEALEEVKPTTAGPYNVL